jgi:hypothetical protein
MSSSVDVGDASWRHRRRERRVGRDSMALALTLASLDGRSVGCGCVQEPILASGLADR